MQIRVSQVSNVEPSRNSFRFCQARRKLSCAAQSASPVSCSSRYATRVIRRWYWRTKYSKPPELPARISWIRRASSTPGSVSRGIMARAGTPDRRTAEVRVYGRSGRTGSAISQRAQDFFALAGVLLGRQQTAQAQVFQLLQPLRGRGRRGSRRSARDCCRGSRRGRRGRRARGGRRGRLPPDRVAKGFGPRDVGEHDPTSLRGRLEHDRAVSEQSRHDALVERDVLDLLDRRLLRLPGEEADFPHDAAVGDDELVRGRSDPPEEEGHGRG